MNHTIEGYRTYHIGVDWTAKHQRYKVQLKPRSVDLIEGIIEVNNNN